MLLLDINYCTHKKDRISVALDGRVTVATRGLQQTVLFLGGSMASFQSHQSDRCYGDQHESTCYYSNPRPSGCVLVGWWCICLSSWKVTVTR